MIPFDVLVIGSGPVGIACAIEAQKQGLSTVVIEKEALLNTLINWPRQTVFFSTPELLEIGGLPFTTSGPKPTRREGLVYYRKAAERYGLSIRLFERVECVRPAEPGFEVVTSKASYQTRAVIVATGFFDNPNLLGVPGEELPTVSHYYLEPFPYAGTDVLVVGGKNSAAEAALDLYRHGARVTMAVRGPEFGKSVKYWLRPDLENRVKEGSIRALFETTVSSIEPGKVILEQRGERMTIANEFVLALTGYHPDFEFLKSLGVEVTADRHFQFDPESMETGVPGLYLAGVVAGGVAIGSLFIENGRNHAVQIVGHILSRRGAIPSGNLTPTPLRLFRDGD